MFFNKLFKFVMLIILLTSFAIFSGCGGGNPVTPPPVEPNDSEIPEPTEELSYKIDLSIGGIIEVTDPESPINGVKLIIPPMSSNKDGKDSIATITISYLDNPYAVELPDNQGFLRTPLIISSEVILDTDCILEIPYTEDDLSNAGASSNETVNVYRYSYTSSSWEKVIINKRIHKDTGDILKIIFKPEDIDKPISSTILNSYPPSNLGLPQPGDLLYKLGSILPWEKEAKGWRPGHVGIYVGELVYDGVIFYNVIEALSGGVQRSYYNPISAFSGSATYMGARQPESITLTSFQRDSIVISAKGQVGMPYAWGQSIGILWGMLRGDLVKGNYGTFNCVGLAEKAYEIAGINNFEGLVSDWDEGNSYLCILPPICVLTPAEQYGKTEPAEGYTVSGRVTNSWGNGIPGVNLNFELVSFNNYHPDIIKVTTNSGGYWSSDKLGREWKITPQKDGYTFEPTTRKVKEDANDIDFTSTSEPEILTPEEIESIRKWGYGGDYVVRWPDGFVGVYDETNYSRMQDVINEWNDAINGPVKFYLSSNPNSPVKVIFDLSLELEGFCGDDNMTWGDDYAFSEVMIKINPYCDSYNYPLYLHMFNAVAGFNAWADVSPCPFETWSSFYSIPDMIKTMVHALHKVPPGYYLGDSKQRRDWSNSTKNISVSGSTNCTK